MGARRHQAIQEIVHFDHEVKCQVDLTERKRETETKKSPQESLSRIAVLTENVGVNLNCSDSFLMRLIGLLCCQRTTTEWYFRLCKHFFHG